MKKHPLMLRKTTYVRLPVWLLNQMKDWCKENMSNNSRMIEDAVIKKHKFKKPKNKD